MKIRLRFSTPEDVQSWVVSVISFSTSGPSNPTRSASNRAIFPAIACSNVARMPSFTPDSRPLLHCSESCETRVLVEDFHIREANGSQQFQLKDQRPGRVFLGDGPEHVVPIRLAFSPARLSDLPFDSTTRIGWAGRMGPRALGCQPCSTSGPESAADGSKASLLLTGRRPDLAGKRCGIAITTLCQ